MKRFGWLDQIRLRIFLLFVLPLSLFLFGMSYLLQQEPPEFSTLEEILMWVAGAGGLWIAGKAQAYLIENWTGWHDLPHLVKVLFPVFLSGILGTVAEAVLAADLLAYIPAAFGAALLAAINYYGSQKAYLEIKASGDDGYGKSARTIAELRASDG